MLTDTHFHFSTIKRKDINVEDMLKTLGEKKYRFLLDIGTDVEDIFSRKTNFISALENLQNNELKNYLKNIMYFTIGLWPSPESIANREDYVCKIEKYLTDNIANKENHVVALGECGLDRFHNKDGFAAEEELFEMQIQLAKKLDLPLIIHSRDAFEATFECIKNMNYHNGIIHCYSYGKTEAEKFLDLGWYISFSGSATYAKKSKIDEMLQLINYIPEDRLLLETDAPYMAPNPCRGQINTPVLIEHLYDFVAKARNISLDILSDTIYNNSKQLFKL